MKPTFRACARAASQGDHRCDAGPDVHGQGHRDRQQPDSDGTGAPASTQATNFKVVVTLDAEIPEVRPGFTCTAEITTAVRDRRDRGADPGDDGPRDDRRRQGEHRPPTGDRAEAAPSECRRRAGRGAEARADAQGARRRVRRSENNKAEFMPVKTGIAGEKYFEVLSGLKEGDAGHHGTVLLRCASCADGAAVKVERRPATTAREQADEPVLRGGEDRAAARSGRTSCDRF